MCWLALASLPLARVPAAHRWLPIDAIKISADEIRELLFQAGCNFDALHNIIKRLLKRLIATRYHVFLDFNISNNAYYLESFVKAGYQIFIVHAHPPEAFIQRKILSGNMKHELTFFFERQTPFNLYGRLARGSLPKSKKVRETVWHLGRGRHVADKSRQNH